MYNGDNEEGCASFFVCDDVRSRISCHLGESLLEGGSVLSNLSNFK